MQKTSQSMQKQKSINTICCVAGRSGGHIVPCLTWAKKSNAQNILFFSTHVPLDKALLKNEPVHHIPLTLSNIPYSNPLRMIQFAWHFGIALLKSLYYLRKYKPEKVLSTGGYIALPVCFAAKYLGIPIELFELNVSPGKATKFLASFATTINICFEKSRRHFPQKKCVVTEYPLRFTQTPKLINADKLYPHKKTIMILGGSQGSQFLNKVIKQWIEDKKNSFESFDKLRTNGLANSHPVRAERNEVKLKYSNGNKIKLDNLHIIHQTGSAESFDWQEFYKKFNIQATVFDYHPHLEQFYPSVDVVLCRAGAGTLFETLFFKKPCITIPLATKTTAHQKENALALAEEYPELVTVMAQKDIEKSPHSFFTLLETTLSKSK